MKKRHLFTLIGFLLFLLGAIALVVNLIGLTFAITDWIDVLVGKTTAFIIKLVLTIGGLIMAIAANSKAGEEPYDEYFDGEKYY